MQKLIFSLIFLCFFFKDVNTKTEQKVILLIGDSEACAVAMHKKGFESDKLRIKHFCKVGSHIRDWPTKMSTILKNEKHDGIMIFLGANDYYSKPDMTEILNVVRNDNTKCLWVGPPKLWNRGGKVNNHIKDNLNGTCDFLDSQTINLELPDKVHPSWSSAKKWLKIALEHIKI